MSQSTYILFHRTCSISDSLHELNWWSGLQKDLRKDKTADLQEAFINLAKSVEADPPPELLAAERNRDATGTFGEVRPRKFECECFASVVRYQIHIGKIAVLPVLPTAGRRVGYKHLQWLKRETFHYFFPPLSTLIQIPMMGSKSLWLEKFFSAALTEALKRPSLFEIALHTKVSFILLYTPKKSPQMWDLSLFFPQAHWFKYVPKYVIMMGSKPLWNF